MRKGFALPLIVVLLVSILILGGIAFLKFKSSSQTPISSEQKQSLIQSTVNPIPSTVPTPTAPHSKSTIIGESVLYTNQVLDFSIKYPKSWIINECEDSVMFGGRCGTEAAGNIVIYKWSNMTDSTKSLYENALDFYSKIKKENVSINGNSGFRTFEILNSCDGPCPPKGTIYVNYIFKDKNSGALVFHYTQRPEDVNNLSIFDQMVSTFNFLQ